MGEFKCLKIQNHILLTSNMMTDIVINYLSVKNPKLSTEVQSSWTRQHFLIPPVGLLALTWWIVPIITDNATFDFRL